jgi:putative spermidine/putrescine transport system substrate-binding protein
MPPTLPPRAVVLACALALLAACGRGGDREGHRGAAAAGKRESALEGQVRLLALPGVLERGRDPGGDWIGAFERASGCKVRIDAAASVGDLYARLAGPGIDVAIVPGDLVRTLAATGDVQPIDAGRVGGLDGVAPRLANGAWALDETGSRFAVPLAWRPQVLLYRRAAFAAPPTGVEAYVPQALADGQASTGRVQAADTPLAIADAALFLAATRPELRIDDPFALDATQYAAALDLLRRQHALLQRYGSDRAAQEQELRDGALVLAAGWPALGGGPAGTADDAVAWVAPASGLAAQVDASVLSVRAAHPNCAYAGLAWSLDVPAQAAAARALGAVPANAAACRDASLGEDACRAHGAELLGRAHFRRAPQARCARRGGCVPYSRWVADFHALRGG